MKDALIPQQVINQMKSFLNNPLVKNKIGSLPFDTDFLEQNITEALIKVKNPDGSHTMIMLIVSNGKPPARPNTFEEIDLEYLAIALYKAWKKLNETETDDKFYEFIKEIVDKLNQPQGEGSEQ